MSGSNPILVALDLPGAEEAVRTARRLAPYVGGFKVGMELLMGAGPATVAAVADLGRPVFADAKLHDIPTTVERAAARLGRYGARWVTCHALGGRTQLEAAAAGLAAGAGGDPSGILAVTVLTSLGGEDLAEAGLPASPGRLTARLARLAEAAGCEGVICAVRELGVVVEVAPRLLKVTPGIRPEGAEPGDQARVATPGEAIRRGADYLVIGRPILGAPDPEAAAQRIAQSLEEPAR